ncbi:hypothetical protein CNBG_5256 [Cryptococcus deuterogattii R265]|uniref:uncharacterized protein n=1 Tax=Cryptococcus deuterogattii (strain R265) TaxID=294750 RepID=UPI0019387F31|nr:hypothetical protein CNBG_5256 [Cryptococcus deuterogattii R265]
MGSGFGEDWKSISEDTNVIDHHKAPQATPRQEANRDNMECNIPKEVPESNNDGHIKSVSQWRTVTLHPQVQVDAPDANPPNPKLKSPPFINTANLLMYTVMLQTAKKP